MGKAPECSPGPFWVWDILVFVAVLIGADTAASTIGAIAGTTAASIAGAVAAATAASTVGAAAGAIAASAVGAVASTTATPTSRVLGTVASPIGTTPTVTSTIPTESS